MILHHRIRYMLQKRGLARARLGHNEPALSLPNGRNHIDDARGIALRLGFHLQRFAGVDDRQLIKGRLQTARFRRITIHGVDFVNLLASAAFADGALDPMSVFQIKTTHQFRRDKDVGRMLGKVVGGIPQKTEALA